MLPLKKLSLSILSLFFALSIAYPQNFDFGVSFKMINSDMLLNDLTIEGFTLEIDTYRDWSWGAAALARYSFTENWSIIAEPGFYFTKYGEDLATSAQSQGSRDNFKHYYISLPLFFQYKLWERLGIELGPEVKYLISYDPKIPLLKESIYESMNLAAVAGLHFAVLDFLDLGIRYHRGLTPFFKVNITDINGQPSDNYFKKYHESYQTSLRLWF